MIRQILRLLHPLSSLKAGQIGLKTTTDRSAGNEGEAGQRGGDVNG